MFSILKSAWFVKYLNKKKTCKTVKVRCLSKTSSLFHNRLKQEDCIPSKKKRTNLFRPKIESSQKFF